MAIFLYEDKMNRITELLLGFIVVSLIGCSGFSKTENEISDLMGKEYGAEVSFSKGISINDSVGDFYTVSVELVKSVKNDLFPSLVIIDFYNLFHKRGLDGPEMIEVEVSAVGNDKLISSKFRKKDYEGIVQVLPGSKQDLDMFIASDYYTVFEKYLSNDVEKEEQFVKEFSDFDMKYGSINKHFFLGWESRYKLYFQTVRAKLTSILVLEYLLEKDSVVLNGVEIN